MTSDVYLYEEKGENIFATRKKIIKHKQMLLKSYLTLNYDCSSKRKNCTGAGRLTLKKTSERYKPETIF